MMVVPALQVRASLTSPCHCVPVSLYDYVTMSRLSRVTMSGTYGTCYAATECEALGGSSLGQCAGGFGVCCSLTGSCGGRTSVNNTYFTAGDSPSSPCQFTVCKTSDEVCQIRLNFDTFDIGQPSNTQAGDGLAGQRTQCVDAQFSVTGDGSSPPVICGTNTGHHMIVGQSQLVLSLDLVTCHGSSL